MCACIGSCSATESRTKGKRWIWSYFYPFPEFSAAKYSAHHIDLHNACFSLYGVENLEETCLLWSCCFVYFFLYDESVGHWWKCWVDINPATIFTISHDSQGSKFKDIIEIQTKKHGHATRHKYNMNMPTWQFPKMQDTTPHLGDM